MIKKISLPKKEKKVTDTTDEEIEGLEDNLEGEEVEDKYENFDTSKDNINDSEKDDNTEEEEEEEEEDDDDDDEVEESIKESHLPKEKSWIKKDGELAVDIYETDNDIVIMAPIGGVRRDEIEIITEKDMVIVKGNRERKEKEDIKNFYSKECFFGPFSREIILPEETDPSRIKANLENGVLVIRAPKIEREKRRKINI